MTRQLLEKDTTYFVHPTLGDDINDGSENVRYRALKTINRAIALVMALDNGGHTVTIKIATGIYDETVVLDRPFVGGGKVILQGNPLNRSAVLIRSSAVGLGTITLSGHPELHIHDLTLVGIWPNAQPNLTSVSRAWLFLERVNLSLHGGQTALVAINGGHIDMTGDSTLFGSGQGLVYCSSLGYVRMYAGVMTITPGNHYNYFIRSRVNATVRCTFTFAGGLSVPGFGVTGVRAQIEGCGVVNTEHADPDLPGDVAPMISTGGQYIFRNQFLE